MDTMIANQIAGRVCRGAAWACVLLGLSAGGCASATSHVVDAQGIYAGTRYDLRHLAAMQEDDGLALLDLAPSVALDTVLLPWDLIHEHTGPATETD